MANIKMNSKQAKIINSNISKIGSLVNRAESWKNEKELVPEAYLSLIREIKNQVSRVESLLIKTDLTDNPMEITINIKSKGASVKELDNFINAIKNLNCKVQMETDTAPSIAKLESN